MYSELFGGFPQELETLSQLAIDAAPKKTRNLPGYLNEWCADTMTKDQEAGYPTGNYDVARDSYFRDNTSDELAANWENLPIETRRAINEVFYNFGVALGSTKKEL